MAGTVPTRKVVAASTTSVVTAFVLWLLGAVVFGGTVPAVVSDFVIILVPGLTAGVVAWWVRDVEHKDVAP
jgi:uncharacterized membrane protein YoaK (UPF0700 family)